MCGDERDVERQSDKKEREEEMKEREEEMKEKREQHKRPRNNIPHINPLNNYLRLFGHGHEFLELRASPCVAGGVARVGYDREDRCFRVEPSPIEIGRVGGVETIFFIERYDLPVRFRGREDVQVRRPLHIPDSHLYLRKKEREEEDKRRRRRRRRIRGRGRTMGERKAENGGGQEG
jgi:hypothetical protein